MLRLLTRFVTAMVSCSFNCKGHLGNHECEDLMQDAFYCHPPVSLVTVTSVESCHNVTMLPLRNLQSMLCQKRLNAHRPSWQFAESGDHV